ncbi:MAG: FeoB-associated Cys-rich membrane protein [Lachnospiraceae bacterium]|nr:FeoB-associated Cys-rich membrane protein [Lachnospiraceae bacterium]MBQ6993174.1 FeoB-associated Cys-rich membrane protein [Lachnospiraceae bacterium]
MANIVVVAVVLVIIGAAIAYIIKEKKKGVKCIGCSAAGSCSHNCSGTSGCGSHTNTKE